MTLRGLDVPRRIGVERLDVFETAQREVIERELKAIDQNMREVLSRVEINVARLSPTGSYRTLPSGLFIPVIVDALPTLPDEFFPDGALAVLTSDWKLYRNDSGTWSAAVETVDLDGTITETQIEDDAISTPKLQAGVVTTAKLAAGAVTANEIAANTITAAEIAAGAIGASELAVNAVTAAKIQAGAVTATKISVSNLSAISADMGSLTAGSIVIGSTDKLWLNDSGDGALNIGGSSKASAPFRVTAAGALTATSATVTGTIVGGSIVQASSFTASNPVFDGSISVKAGESNPKVVIDTTFAAQGRIKLYDENDNLRGTLECTLATGLVLNAEPNTQAVNFRSGGALIGQFKDPGSVSNDGTNVLLLMKPGTASVETRIVVVGAADSGGSGYRMLRVQN